MGDPPKKLTGRQRGTDDTFTGRAAQLAVVSELLRRRCNAAIPEVDLGTDVFAFKEDREEVVRIQVKACTTPGGYADGSGYSAKFTLPMKQFKQQEDRPPLYYTLATLREGKWGDFLIVSRRRLQDYYDNKKFGSLNKSSNELEITVEFRDTMKCSGQDLTDCRNAWGSLPPLRTQSDLAHVTEEKATGTDRTTATPVADGNGGGDGEEEPKPDQP